MRTVRVRYAPSPTGALHLGGLRTALFNYLFARRHGGAFLLRVEDTDRARTVPGAVEGIVRALDWAGITPDEGPFLSAAGELRERGDAGPYTQSNRLGAYRAAADALVESGAAYCCFCAAARLAAMRDANAAAGARGLAYDRACAHLPRAESTARVARGEPHVVRLRVPPGETRIRDVILGDVVFAHADVDDAVLLKSDGWPTYHLASVVDDAAMKVSHVIRGQEWLPSAPKHSLLYRALGIAPPAWAHIPLLLNADRSKLSKRAGHASVEDFRSAGFTAPALIEFVASLGWTPPTGAGADVAALAKAFDLGAVHKANAVADRSRLDSISNQHVRASVVNALSAAAPHALEPSRKRATGGTSAALIVREGALPMELESAPSLDVLRAGVEPFLPRGLAARVTAARMNALLALQHERVGPLSEFSSLVTPFLLSGGAPEYLEYLSGTAATAARGRALGSAADDTPALSALAAAIRDTGARWTRLSDPLDFGRVAVDAIKAAALAAEMPPGRLMLPVRWALTGLDVGASLSDTLRFLGREEAIVRLDVAANILVVSGRK